MKIKLDPGAYQPERAHKTDAGMDIRSIEYGNIDKSNITIEPITHQKLSLIENFFFLTIFTTYNITIIDTIIKYLLSITYSPS